MKDLTSPAPTDLRPVLHLLSDNHEGSDVDQVLCGLVALAHQELQGDIVLLLGDGTAERTYRADQHHPVGVCQDSSATPRPTAHRSAVVDIPVTARTRPVGRLLVSTDALTADEHEFLETVAMAVGVALEQHSVRDRSRRRQTWLAAVADVTTHLIDLTDEQEALQLIADRAREAAGADVSWVVLGDAPDLLRLHVVSGLGAEPEAMASVQLEHSLAAHVVRTGETVLAPDLSIDERAVDPSATLGWPPLGPTIVVPLGQAGRPEGVLALAWTQAHADGATLVEPELPAGFAEQVVLALQVARDQRAASRLTLLEDRERIGRDLHDTVIQRLFAAGLTLDAIARQAAVLDQDLADQLARSVDDLDQTVEEIRRTIFAVGSLGAEGDLASEVRALVDRAAASLKLRPTLALDGDVASVTDGRLITDVLTVLGEALSNVARHASAGAVRVRVAVDHDLRVEVADDGVGFTAGAPRSGLANLEERARTRGGSLQVVSGDKGGTQILWSVPVSSAGRNA